MEPVQGLNMKRRSISGLKKNALNNTLGNLIAILDELAKLRSAIIYFVMSVFLIATTPIQLGEFL
jgi:hypothetical protein